MKTKATAIVIAGMVMMQVQSMGSINKKMMSGSRTFA